MSPKRAAFCLHGFLRTGLSMFSMARVLREVGYETHQPTFFYQVVELPVIAQRLAEDIREVARRTGPVDLVTHSYGGILARAVISHAPVRRVVMLAPPNQGAQVAELARKYVPVHQLGWDPLAQILPGVPAQLPRGSAEVAIITGGTGTDRGYNPLLDGDNDQTVRVEEAKLEGVEHFRVLPVRHTFIMNSAEAQHLALHFLEQGHFPAEK